MGQRLDKVTNKRFSARSNPKPLSRKAKALARFHVMSYAEWLGKEEDGAIAHAHYMQYVDRKNLEIAGLKRKLGVQ